MNEWKCRECQTPVTGSAHVRLGRSITRGSNALCLICSDKQRMKLHTDNLIDFVPAYVRTQVERNEQAALRDRVAQLERILSDPKALENLLEAATSPNVVKRVV